MSERTDEREPVDYAADARRLLKMLDERKARRTTAIVPANSDCNPSRIRAVTPMNKGADSREEIDASCPERLGGAIARDGK